MVNAFMRSTFMGLSLLYVGVVGAEDETQITHTYVDDETFGEIAKRYDYDHTIPLEAVMIGKWPYRQPYIIEKIEFQSTNDQTVPALYAYPKERAEGDRLPAIVLLNGWSSFWGKYEPWCLDMIDILARAGYCIVCIDLPTFGERLRPGMKMYTQLEGEARETCLIQSVTDLRRATDFLLTRPEVDPERIGLVGGSLGGLFATFTAALDNRFAVVVLTVTGLWGTDQDPDDPQYRDTHMANFAPRINAPVMMLNATGDNNARIEALYDLLPEPKQIIWKESGHYLPPKDHSDELMMWLDQHLK